MGDDENSGRREVVRPTRRDVLRALAAAPLCAASACACARDYPRPLIAKSRTRDVVDAILTPTRLNRRAGASVIDTHAHFFNAADVPVRGFIAESIGHNVAPSLQFVVKEAASLAEKFAERAPTAYEELTALQLLSSNVRGRSGRDLQDALRAWFERERTSSAERVSSIVSGTRFERRYREIVPAPRTRSGGQGISPEEVKEAEDETTAPADPRTRIRIDEAAKQGKAFLQFLRLMVSYRASNVRTYTDAFSPADGTGVDMVLGALVDFDYWLDCPPRSAHEDQIALHEHLAAMHGGYLRPVAGYNPWTDIEQNGAGLQRLMDAWDNRGFVGVKIYPPTGFMPARNAGSAASTQKVRPDLQELDKVLRAFFAKCANKGIPVIAHTARSNGRDAAHDDFSSPSAWDALLCVVAHETETPIISLGHFGGDNASNQWTSQFANLMKAYPKLKLFGDIAYWGQLMCEEPAACSAAQSRLKNALATPISGSETVADRVMFGTDWLMLSQVPGWKAYPQRVRAGLETFANAGDVAKIFGTNARTCFARLAS